MSSILKNIILSILLLSVVSSTSHAQIQWEKMYRKLSKKLRKQGSSEYELDEAMVHPGVEVMGIEPSWCVSKHSFDKYHFNAFSTIVVGEYDINPETGKPRSNRSFSGVLFGDHIEESGQEWTLVKRAKKLNSNVNVNVSIVFSGDYGIGKKNREQHYRFFDGTGNRDVRQVLVDSLKYTFDRFEKEYGISPRNSGVFINIPQLPIRDNDQINTVDAYFKFIEFLVSKLDENTLINIKIPYNFFPTKKMSEGQKQKYFDDFTKRFETINERVNLYVLEGYTTRPTLKKPDPTDMELVEVMVNIMNEHFKLPKEKIIVEFPGFGSKIDNKSRTISTMTLDNIEDIVGTGKVKYNADQTKVYYQSPLDSTYYYYDDPTTFGKKMLQLNELEIKGVAYNGLGYNTIKGDKFMEQFKDAGFLKRKDEMWLVIAGFLGLFLPIGMISSIINSWEVRNALAKHKSINFNFWMAFLILTFIGLFLFFAGNMFIMILAAICIAIFMARKYLKKAAGKIRKITRYGKYVGT